VNKDDKDIIDKLRKLPKVKDRTDKEELYEQIQAKINRTSKTRESKTYQKKMISVFSAILAVVIILIMIPSFVDDTMLRTSKSNVSDDDKSFETAMDTQEISINAEENSIESSGNHADDAESNESVTYDFSNSYIVNNINSSQTIVHGAIVEEQLQYVIPITFITENEADLSTLYNELNNYLVENNLGALNELFKDVTFNIDLEQKQVVLKFPEHYSLGEGSTRANVFSEMLSAMFYPYGIEKVVFQNHTEVDLGALGEVAEMEILDPPRANYKLYRNPELDRAFLTPIMQEQSHPIADALDDMKNADEFYHLSQTIPNEVNFTVESVEKELLIRFTEGAILENNDIYITMIEAILMTAKNYQYESVTFENFNIEQSGPYNLSESLEVPQAINPITITE